MIRFRLIGAVAAALVLAGCGGGEPAAEVPADPQEKALKFAQCMRDNGIDMPDPEPGQPPGAIRMPAGRADGDMAKMEKAMESCRKFSPMGNVDPNDPAVKDRQLKFAQCMRDRGFDVPDPSATQKGQTFQVPEGDRDGFEKAMKECRPAETK